MTAGGGLNGQINVFESLRPVLCHAGGVLVRVLRSCSKDYTELYYVWL